MRKVDIEYQENKTSVYYVKIFDRIYMSFVNDIYVQNTFEIKICLIDSK